MAKQAEKLGRAFRLSERQATGPKLSTTPEKAGHDLSKTCDFSVDFTMKGAELNKLDKGLSALWDTKGMPSIENLAAPIRLGAAFRGVATIGSVRGSSTEFTNARLLDFKIEPRVGHELAVRARFRLYLTHETDQLYDLEIAQTCKVGFVGKLIISAKSQDDEESDSKKQADIED